LIARYENGQNAVFLIICIAVGRCQHVIQHVLAVLGPAVISALSVNLATIAMIIITALVSTVLLYFILVSTVLLSL